MEGKTAVIIGAGPAGLTAAYELLHKTSIRPVVLEKTGDIGGISKTVNYKGNRIDIGGHRFFSKSDIVMDWWQNVLPIESDPELDSGLEIKYQNKTKIIQPGSKDVDPHFIDKVLLIRRRISRIYFLRKFFNYPLSLNIQAILNLGVIRSIKIFNSYLISFWFPIKNEKSLEDFFINRFGRELYQTFFKDYTEKVWGVSCKEIAPDWGAQRIKGLSISKALFHAIRKAVSPSEGVAQKNVETSLIERFLYPKYGPGQMWEEVTRIVREKGGEVKLNERVVRVRLEGRQVSSISIRDEVSGQEKVVHGNYFISSMPVKDLIAAIDGDVPDEVKRVAEGLMYRDFITVGLLLNKLSIPNNTKIKTMNNLIPDNWIYIQESDVRVGRLQIFNNWSPYMVNDPNKVWIGLEYFCNEGDALWIKTDDEFKKFAISELCKIGIIDKDEVIDSVVIRVEKTYPAYFGTYDEFETIREFVNGIENLYLVGRNGMHRYNNQDHSMLTAIEAVNNIKNSVISKENIWSVNVEEEYHEEK